MTDATETPTKAKVVKPRMREALLIVLVFLVLGAPALWFLPQVIGIWVPPAEARALANVCVLTPIFLWVHRLKQRHTDVA